jgi:hypothetical protein
MRRGQNSRLIFFYTHFFEISLDKFRSYDIKIREAFGIKIIFLYIFYAKNF